MAFLQEKQLPIQFLSSSVSDDYRSAGTISGLRVDVQKHHSEDIFDRQGVIQTTRSKAFKNQGYLHRNQDIASGSSTALNRPEVFYITLSDPNIVIRGGKSLSGTRDENVPASSFFELKKIYSIDWLRGKNYQSSQPLFFGDDSARSTNVSLTSSIPSSVPNGRITSQSQYSQIPSRERQEEAYLQRFSAPGDSLTLTIGNLDFFESKKSAWNDLNFRNLRLREEKKLNISRDILSSSFGSISGSAGPYATNFSGALSNQFVKIPIPGRLEDNWWMRQSVSSYSQSFFSLPHLSLSEVQAGIFPRPDSTRNKDMNYSKDDASSSPIIRLNQKKARSTFLKQNQWNLYSDDSSNNISVQQSPILYSENIFLRTKNREEYKCFKDFSPFGEEYHSYLDYGGTSGKTEQAIEEPRFVLPKQAELFSIEKMIWPKKSRAFLPELTKRENYSFPWNTSSVSMADSGPTVNSINQTYAQSSITESFSMWPMQVYSDAYTNFSKNGELMQGDNEASFQSSLFSPYVAPVGERYFHCSYGRIIYDYLSASVSRIPLNLVQEEYQKGRSPIFHKEKSAKQFSGYSVIPEYRINDCIYEIISNKNIPESSKFISSISGAFNLISSLSGTQTSETNLEIVKKYNEKWSYSDFILDKNILECGTPKSIKLKFDAVLNFVPYEGFYPHQRILQLSNLYASYYFPLIERSGTNRTYATAYKPIFNLMTNCIRAGVALDYPVMMQKDLTNLAVMRNPSSGLTYSPFGSVFDGNLVLTSSLKTTFTSSLNALYLSRISFESLWNPYQAFKGQNILDWDIEVADLDSTASIIANAPEYDFAAENFIAESQRFFLRNERFPLAKLESKPSIEWNSPKLFMPDGGTSSYPQVYMMDVVFKKYGLTNHDSLSFYGHHPHIYHAPFYATAPWLSLLSGSLKEQTVATASWLKFTESHANNDAIARITFDLNYLKSVDPVRYSKIVGGDKLTVNDIVSFSKIQYINQDIETDLSSIPGGVPQTFMKMDAGINIFQKTQDDKWIIYPKGEFPNFDFSQVSARSRDFNETSSVVGNVMRGMWHQYISMPTQSLFYESNNGLFLSVKDVPTASIGAQTYESYRSTLTGSLAQLCGFNFSESERIGQIEEKIVSEAILVIPIIESCGKENFINLKVDKFEESFCKDEIENSIDHSISLAKKYVLPYHLDFISERRIKDRPMKEDEFKTIKPFAFYIVECSEKFSQRDFADIWQGVAPRSAFAMKEQEIIIEHPLGEEEMLSSSDLSDSLRFKLIKIKKRAESSYQNIIADAIGKKKKEFKHSYNWPYDFFSLIEFGRLQTEVQFRASRKNIIDPLFKRKIIDPLFKNRIIDPLFRESIIDPLFAKAKKEIVDKLGLSELQQGFLSEKIVNSIIDPLFSQSIIDPLFKKKIIDPLFFDSIIDPLFKNSIIDPLFSQSIIDPLFKDRIIDPLFFNSIIDPLFKNSKENIIDPLFNQK